MRLDQFISKTLGLSRQQAKLRIKSGQITVDAQKAIATNMKVSPEQMIQLDNKSLAWPEHQYWILNKPAGYCCSHVDDGHPSIFHLLPPSHEKCHIAGRLDADTTGLVLISTDGHWCHRVASPKQKQLKSKHYSLTLSSPLREEDRVKLTQGILLNGEKRPTLDCDIASMGDGYKIILHEGKYHQIKRMFAALGYKLTSLHRYQVADIQLNDLGEGHYRKLSQDEIACFNPMPVKEST